MNSEEYQTVIANLLILIAFLFDHAFWMHGRMFTEGPSPWWTFIPGGGVLRVFLGK